MKHYRVSFYNFNNNFLTTFIITAASEASARRLIDEAYPYRQSLSILRLDTA